MTFMLASSTIQCVFEVNTLVKFGNQYKYFKNIHNCIFDVITLIESKETAKVSILKNHTECF